MEEGIAEEIDDEELLLLLLKVLVVVATEEIKLEELADVTTKHKS